jgi:hypothetical protein
MLSDLGPRNCLNGTGVDLGNSTLDFAPPFFFVEEFPNLVHKAIVNLFRMRGRNLSVSRVGRMFTAVIKSG